MTNLITRRTTLLAALSAPFTLAGCAGVEPGPDGVYPPRYATGPALEREQRLPADAPLLYVVSAPDCPSCYQWHRDKEPAFESSAARSRLRVVHLHARSIKSGSGLRETWPADAWWVRNALEDHDVFLVTPIFALVRGRDYLAGAWGLSDWEKVMLPAIRSAAGVA